MPRKGNCWNNAVDESFFKSLKTELIYENKLITREKMKTQIFEFNNNLQFLKYVA